MQEFTDCRLRHQHAGNDVEACAYPAKDLSWMQVRLSV